MEGVQGQCLERNIDDKASDVAMDSDEPRYTAVPFCSSGMGEISSTSTSFCGDLVVRVLKDDKKGSIEDGKGGLCVNLLRMVMNDGVEAIFEEEG